RAAGRHRRGARPGPFPCHERAPAAADAARPAGAGLSPSWPGARRRRAQAGEVHARHRAARAAPPGPHAGRYPPAVAGGLRGLTRLPGDRMRRYLGLVKPWHAIGGRPAPWQSAAGGDMKRARTKPASKKRGRAKSRLRARGSDPVEAALAALAHEVRTPLNGILAFGELLAASQLPERERGWAAGIKSAAEHLSQLTSVIVDGAKARGPLVLQSAPFRPRALAESVAASLHARAQTKGLATTVTIAEDLPAFVVGDAVRLRAALENLVDNAVKFTERGGVALDAAAGPAGRNRTRLTFTVGDSG